MCDFLSCVIRRDGAVSHVWKNSHSGAVAAAGWQENDQMAQLRGVMRFVEAEWNGEGKYPGARHICRNSDGMTAQQIAAVDRIYGALASLIDDPKEHAEAMCLGDGLFAEEQWADVRLRVYLHPGCPDRVRDRLVKSKLACENLIITKEVKVSLPECVEVSGYVDVQQGATFTAPALTKSGSVDVRQGATFTAPALTKSGYVSVQQGATFTAPALTEVSGSVSVQQGATFTAPALTKSGYVSVQQGATFTAPALTKVSGYVYVRQGATFTAPKLKRK